MLGICLIESEETIARMKEERDRKKNRIWLWVLYCVRIIQHYTKEHSPFSQGNGPVKLTKLHVSMNPLLPTNGLFISFSLTAH